MTLGRRDSLEECCVYENFSNDDRSGDKPKVSLFAVRGSGSSGRYRLAAGTLALLCAALLMAVIGMAVLINGMNAELRSQVKALEDKNKQQDLRIAKLGHCGSCPSGWKALNDTCFYFADKSSCTRKGWDDSRAECTKLGADLAIVDTLEKQMFISDILSGRHHTAGYWIGLHDKVSETWVWTNGASLTKGYWMDGEPNDHGTAEDCAATYPSPDCLKSWNDVPCGHPLSWICEKKAAET